MFDLTGRTALVTGAATGLGQAIAVALTRSGARVAISNRSDLSLDETATLCAEAGETPMPLTIDVRDLAQIAAGVAAVEARLGHIDILVNNAGICPRLPFEESTEEDWEHVMGVNARSQYFLTQAVCPIMRRQGGGRIINVASTAGRTGTFANASIYSGTKGAVVMFTKSIAREVAEWGILVNCIAPGVMDTDLMGDLPEEKVRAICDQIPLKRLGRPDEVAAFIAFMASDECSYATGATFDVNGGWIML